MKISISLILLLAIIMLVGSGINNQANSYSPMGSYRSCLHNSEEFIQISLSQSCFNPHANIGNSIAKHSGQNPEDCILEDIIVIGQFD